MATVKQLHAERDKLESERLRVRAALKAVNEQIAEAEAAQESKERASAAAQTVSPEGIASAESVSG